MSVVVLVIGPELIPPALLQKVLAVDLVVIQPAESYERAAAEHNFPYKLRLAMIEPDERPKPAPMWKGQQYRKGKREK